jgi:hypothetical protein
MYTREVSEQVYPLVTAYPDDRGPGTHNSDFVSLSTYHRAWLLVEVGDIGQGAAIYGGLQQASDAAGTGVKAITGKQFTLLDTASNLVCIELQTEELDVDNHFEYVRFYITTLVGTVIYSATLFGVESRFEPVPTTNWAERVH